MTDLDTIRNTLNINNNLSQEIKDNIFELIVLFNKNFNSIALDNLNERLKTLKIERINSFLSKRVSKYDKHKNTIYFNDKELNKNYDVKHILMFELINIIATNNEISGFNFDNKFTALNIGYTEMLANYLVGNDCEEMLYPQEALMTNLLSIIVGEEVLEKAYFQNDYKLLLDTVKKVGIDLAGKNGFMNWNSLANYYSNRGE